MEKRLPGYANHRVCDGVSFHEHTMNGSPCPGPWRLLIFEKDGAASFHCEYCRTSVHESAPRMYAEINAEFNPNATKRVEFKVTLRNGILTVNEKKFNVKTDSPDNDFYNLKFDGYGFFVKDEEFFMIRQSGGWIIRHSRAYSGRETPIWREILTFDDCDCVSYTVQLEC